MDRVRNKEGTENMRKQRKLKILRKCGLAEHIGEDRSDKRINKSQGER